MKVELVEHKAKKKTRYGKIEKSLNQYIVMMQRDDMPHAIQVGYFGTQKDAKFLPLCGFPDELADEVCKGIQEWLAENKDQYDKKPDAVPAPPSDSQVEEAEA